MFIVAWLRLALGWLWSRCLKLARGALRRLTLLPRLQLVSHGTVPAVPFWAVLRTRRFPWPRRKVQGKKILVLDLDETLVHAQPGNALAHIDWDVCVPDTQGHPQIVYVCERPGLQEFLFWVSQWFRVVIFTASTKEYADPIISRMDRWKVIQKRYYRQDCQRSPSGQYVKDLSRLARGASDVESFCVLIDNLPTSYINNPHNAIPIETFRADMWQTDKALPRLLPLLEALACVSDVRSILQLRTNPGPRTGFG